MPVAFVVECIPGTHRRDDSTDRTNGHRDHAPGVGDLSTGDPAMGEQPIERIADGRAGRERCAGEQHEAAGKKVPGMEHAARIGERRGDDDLSGAAQGGQWDSDHGCRTGSPGGAKTIRAPRGAR